MGPKKKPEEYSTNKNTVKERKRRAKETGKKEEYGKKHRAWKMGESRAIKKLKTEARYTSATTQQQADMVAQEKAKVDAKYRDENKHPDQTDPDENATGLDTHNTQAVLKTTTPAQRRNRDKIDEYNTARAAARAAVATAWNSLKDDWQETLLSVREKIDALEETIRGIDDFQDQDTNEQQDLVTYIDAKLWEVLQAVSDKDGGNEEQT